jgi:hypothetical protein
MEKQLKDVDVNFRYSENSDVYRVNSVENDTNIIK